MDLYIKKPDGSHITIGVEAVSNDDIYSHYIPANVLDQVDNYVVVPVKGIGNGKTGIQRNISKRQNCKTVPIGT